MKKMRLSFVIILMIGFVALLFSTYCQGQFTYNPSFFDLDVFYRSNFSPSSFFTNLGSFNAPSFWGGSPYYQSPMSASFYQSSFGFSTLGNMLNPFSPLEVSPFTSSFSSFPSPFYHPFNPISFPYIPDSSFWGPPYGDIGGRFGIGTTSSAQAVPKKAELVYLVETDKPIYDPGETIDIIFEITNKGKAEAVVDFSSGQQFDVIIKNSEGEEIYQLSSHTSYTQAETSITINPGKTKTYETQWDQNDNDNNPVPLGSYVIKAFLTPKNNKYKGTAITHIGIRNLPTFTDCEELRKKLAELVEWKKPPSYPTPQPIPWTPWQPTTPWIFGGFGGFGMPLYGVGFGGMGAASMAPSLSYSMASGVAQSAPASSTSGGATKKYSTTNTQVAGVDEADVIKNDDTFIYVIKDKDVIIAKADPPDDLQQVAKINYGNQNFTPTQLYVHGHYLVVIGTGYRNKPYYYPDASYKIYYYPRDPFTHVYIYKMSQNRETIDQERLIKVEANYLQSRRVDDYLYIVMNADPPYNLLDEEVNDPSVLLPIFHDYSIHSDDEGEPVVNCNEIAYFPGYTAPNYLIVFAIHIKNPNKPVKRLLVLGKSEQIYCSPENLYVASTSYIDEDFPEPSSENPGIWIPSSFRKKPSTMIYKFEFKAGSIDFEDKAKVPGTIINQFCMDEYDDHFRIVTEHWSGNSLYVLDSQMKLAGRLEELAKGETVRSVRFMGDKAYVVTFRVIDPFFVISLAEHTNPEVVGELKIPGYTKYLHPYDETHLIGVGVVVENNRETGVKVSMFDVSEVTDPIEVDKVEIGENGTHTELLDDHKALLFIKAKNIMAFPIKIMESNGTGFKYKSKYVFQGGLFLHVDENSVEIDGEVSHYPDDYFPVSNIGSMENYIKRIIYIDGHYFTISPGKIKSVNETYDEIDTLILQ